MMKNALRLIHFLLGASITLFCLSIVLLAVSDFNISVNVDTTFLHILWILALTLSTAIFEELIFRLWMIKGLTKATKHVYLAVLISSVIFALLHLGNNNVNALAIFSHFIGGLVYAVCYLHSGSILLPIGVHFGWNFTQYLFGLPMSGSIKEGLFEITFNEKNSFYGGDYGIESGWISVICRILILGIILLIYKKHR